MTSSSEEPPGAGGGGQTATSVARCDNNYNVIVRPTSFARRSVAIQSSTCSAASSLARALAHSSGQLQLGAGTGNLAAERKRKVASS